MENVTKSDIKEILTQLAMLRKDIEYMKTRTIDPDCILSEDDEMSIKEAEKEYMEGKTISHEQLKKELGLKCMK